MNASRTSRPEATSGHDRLRNHSGQDRDGRDRRNNSAVGAGAQRPSGSRSASEEINRGGTPGSRPKGGERQMAKVTIPGRYKKFFTPDAEKIPEVILFVINAGRERDAKLTQYDILKAIWLADTNHLNKFGRPITFDNYVAMEHGPVPSLVYDLLKPEFDYPRVFGNKCPWVSIYNGTANEFVAIRRPPQHDLLSDSDKELLLWGLETVLTLGFRATRRLTHEHPAYEEAWERRGSANAAEMKPELLLDEPDAAFISDLKYISENLPRDA
jgi:hypothetical protein